MAHSYFYEMPCWGSLFRNSTEDFNLQENHVSSIKFAEFCRAGRKWAYEYYLQKCTNIPFSIQSIAANCYDFKSLQLKN